MSDTITVTGNIATEPEHKRTPAGVAITTFRLASGQRRYDRQSGAWIDSGTNWYTVSTFRGLAEHAFSSLHKGDRVILTGRLRLRDWDTGSRKGTTAEIDAEAIGHDLLWGTTHFEKDGPSASSAIQASERLARHRRGGPNRFRWLGAAGLRRARGTRTRARRVGVERGGGRDPLLIVLGERSGWRP